MIFEWWIMPSLSPTVPTGAGGGFVVFDLQCTSWVCWHFLYSGLCYLLVYPIWLHLAHRIEWFCSVQPTGVAASAKKGLSLGILFAGLYCSISYRLAVQECMAFRTCLLLLTGCPVPQGGSPGYIPTRPAIVQKTLNIPSSPFRHVAVALPECLMK